jgi:hypothetical protein
MDELVIAVQSRLKEIDDQLKADKRAYADAEALLAKRANLMERRSTHANMLADLQNTCDHDWIYGLWDRLGQNTLCTKCDKTEFIRSTR